jgi:hypothetical protein
MTNINRTTLLATITVVISGLFIFGGYTWGTKLYLFKDIGSDSINGAFPSYTTFISLFKSCRLPSWSFEFGMGQNIWGFLLGDVFTLATFTCGEVDCMANLLAWREMGKLILAGIIFAFYCSIIFPRKLICIVVGALAYAFSGYAVLGSCWTIHSTEVVYLALWMLAMELWLTKGRWWLIPPVIMLIGLLQPFYYWGFGLFSLPYLLLRREELRRQDGTTPAAAGHGTSYNLAWLLREARFLLPLGLAAVVGVMMSGVLLLSSMDSMLHSPRVGGDASYAGALLSQPAFQWINGPELVTAVLRTFSTDALGTGSGFTGWQNYLEAPVFYCGLVFLLLIPQLFILCPKRLRWVYGLALALAVFPVVFPWFRHAFWLFQGDYYRLLSLFVVTTFILLGLRALALFESGKRPNLPLLAICGCISLLVLFILNAKEFVPYTIPHSTITIFAPAGGYRQGEVLVNQAIRHWASIFIISYTLLLAIWSWWNRQRLLREKTSTTSSHKKTSDRPAPSVSFVWRLNIPGGLLVILTGLELIYFSCVTLYDRPVITKTELRQKVGFNDYTVDALAALRANDQTPFYRVNKDYSSGPAIHGSLNDAMVQNFYGSACYTQFNQLHYIRFLNAMGVMNANNEHETRWCVGLTQRPLLQLWASTKYCLTKNPAPYRESAGGYEEIGTWGDVTAFRYRQWLPLGFTYDHVIAPELFTALAPAARDALLFQAAVVESEDQPALAALASYNPLADAAPFDLGACVARRRQNALTLETFKPDHLSGHITLERNELLFFSIPFDRGWQATVDGQPARLLKVNIGFMGLMLPPGRHTVDMQFRPPLLVPGLVLSGCGLAAYLILLVGFRRRDLRP